MKTVMQLGPVQTIRFTKAETEAIQLIQRKAQKDNPYTIPVTSIIHSAVAMALKNKKTLVKKAKRHRKQAVEAKMTNAGKMSMKRKYKTSTKRYVHGPGKSRSKTKSSPLHPSAKPQVCLPGTRGPNRPGKMAPLRKNQ